MTFLNYNDQIITKFNKQKKKQLIDFLEQQSLDYDHNIDISIITVNCDQQIIATCSLDDNIIKCLAVHPDYQGQNLSAHLLSKIIDYAASKQIFKLFLFTKPQNIVEISALGFELIIQTEDIAWFENKKDGIKDFIREIPHYPHSNNGAIIVNCNPFTKGHRHLIEFAAARCDYLYLFVLAADKSFFKSDIRFDLVKQGTADLDNVIVCSSDDYLISAATFPDYFIKDKIQAQSANCQLDLAVFGRIIAPDLNIKTRFIGKEPYCALTAAYNQKMKEFLPGMGINVVEIPRLKSSNQQEISASKVRELLQENDFAAIEDLVYPTTLAYLKEVYGND